MQYSLFGRGDAWNFTWRSVSSLCDGFMLKPQITPYSALCLNTQMRRDVRFITKNAFYAVDFTGINGCDISYTPPSPYKLRVSVLDSEIERVFAPLFDILFHAKNVTQFKVFSQDLYNSICLRHSVQTPQPTRFSNSMQFTIYLYSSVSPNPEMMPDVDQARILIERINNTLSAMGVAIGFPPPVDIPIEGYVSGRIDQIFDQSGRMQYIPEKELLIPSNANMRNKLNRQFHNFVESMWSPF